MTGSPPYTRDTHTADTVAPLHAHCLIRGGGVGGHGHQGRQWRGTVCKGLPQGSSDVHTVGTHHHDVQQNAVEPVGGTFIGRRMLHNRDTPFPHSFPLLTAGRWWAV